MTYTVTLTSGNDTYSGDAGAPDLKDYVSAGDGDDVVSGGADNDTLVSSNGSDTFSGDAGDDVLIVGGAANAKLSGGDGNDLFKLHSWAGSGAIIDGGSGADTISAGGHYGYIGIESFSGIEAIIDGGYEGPPTMLGTASSQYWDLTGITVTNVLFSMDFGNDTFIGTSGNDYVNGGGGDDFLVGGAGSDTLLGLEGFDTVSYADAPGGITLNLSYDSPQSTGSAGTDQVVGVERVIGSQYADTLSAGLAAATFEGGDGDDLLRSGAGNDVLDGGAGVNTASYDVATNSVTVTLAVTSAQNTGAGGTDTILNVTNLLGSTYNDNLSGNSGDNLLSGGSGADTLNGAAGHDSLAGGDGDDDLTGGAGNDTLTGGAGIDTANYADAASAVTVTLASTSSQSTGGAGDDVLSGIENLRGSAYNDTLTGSTGDNVISGGDGTDSLSGGDGADTLDGGAGDDVLDGGNGSDTASYANASAAVTVTLATTSAQATGGAGSDALSNIENLTGSAYSDTLTGNASANTLAGGQGDDLLVGGSGNDSLIGGDGTDTAVFTGALSNYTVNWSTTVTVTDKVTGEVDTLQGIERLSFSDGVVTPVFGTSGVDTLTGTSQAEVFYNYLGDDSLSGGGGNDIFVIDTGLYTQHFSWIDGGSGSDTIILTASPSLLGVRYLSSVETIQGNGGAAYYIVGTTSNDFIDLSGTTIVGNLQYISGSQGTDTIIGSSAEETFVVGSASAGSIDGGGGNDVFRLNMTAGWAVDIVGGAGNDTISAGNYFAYMGVHSFSGIEAINSGAYSDAIMLGTAGSEYWDLTGVTVTGVNFMTDGGADTIIGSSGHDHIQGGSGDNLMSGGAGGNDTMIGGDGWDTVTYASAPGGVTIDLTVNAQTTGSAGNDWLQLVDAIVGSAYADTLSASNVANALYGDAGDDLLKDGLGNTTHNGGDGTDTLSYAAINTAVTVSLATTSAQTTGAGSDQISNVENLIGTAYNDDLTGDGGANVIQGGSGTDSITGGGGNDSLSGGYGDDLFRYAGTSPGFDAVDGGLGSDTMHATADNTVIGLTSLSGVETITANGYANVSILGSSAANTLDFSAFALTGIVLINGGDGADTLTGSSASDTIAGGAGDDRLNGGDGDDTFLFTGSTDGFDSIDGGLGSDTLAATANSAVIGVSGFSGIEAITAGGYSGVVVRGSSAANNLNFSTVTLTGITVIDGGGGNDTITGTSGADTLMGSAGNDVLVGGFGDDTFLFTGSSGGSDSIDAGGGTDTLLATANNTAIGLSSISGAEVISGGAFSNVTILGSSAANTLDFSTIALTNIGKIDGGGGNDTIIGSSAADTLVGSAGNDSLSGGDGNDVFSYAAVSNGTDVVDGGAGADTIAASANNAVIGLSGFSSIDVIDAGGFSGVGLTGTANADSLDFSAVTLNGIAYLDGAGGNDVLTGSTGADAIRLGAGADTLTGGGGSDIFVFTSLSDSGLGAAADRITDFTVGTDQIDLSGLDADTVTSGDQAFTFIGTAAFSNVAGELRIDDTDPGQTVVLGDIDGDGTADFSIVLTGAMALSTSDFIL